MAAMIHTPTLESPIVPKLIGGYPLQPFQISQNLSKPMMTKNSSFANPVIPTKNTEMPPLNKEGNNGEDDDSFWIGRNPNAVEEYIHRYASRGIIEEDEVSVHNEGYGDSYDPFWLLRDPAMLEAYLGDGEESHCGYYEDEDDDYEEARECSSNESYVCGFCDCVATEAVVTVCGHLYCRRCLSLWLLRLKHNDCYVCYTHIKESTATPIHIEGFKKRGGSPMDFHVSYKRRRLSRLSL